MRLRQSVRPPQRFDTEDFVTPGSQPSQRERQSSSQARPSVIEFNPNLPPAVFPSLTGPHVGQKRAISSDHYSKTQQPNGETRSGQINGQRRSSQNGNGRSDKEMQPVEFEDVSIEEIDNQVASNGRLNPTYVKNMAIMANAAEDPYADMEDSDLDDEMIDSPVAEPETPIVTSRDPQWNDLSPRMQVEIFNNLLQTHNFLAVSHVLGLSVDEGHKVQDRFDLSNQQIELENSELENMRAKQSRALMRVDNSALRRSRVPHQLVFRKASRQCTRRIREDLKTDYLLCQSGELLSARRFLHRRGIDRKHAGDWSNDMVSLRVTQDDSEPEMFEWKEDLTTRHVSPEKETAPSYLAPTPSKRPRLSSPVPEKFSKEAFINATGKALLVKPAELVQRKGELSTALPRWLDQYQKQTQKEKFEQHKKEHTKPAPQNSGLVCLKIGTEGAAKIGNSAHTYLNQDNLFRPQCGSWYRNGLQASGRRKATTLENFALVGHPVFPNTHPVLAPGPPGKTRCPPITTTHPVFSNDDGPVERRIGGNWSYNALDHNPMEHTSFSRTRQKLELAKVEEQVKRAGQLHALCRGQTGGPDNSIIMGSNSPPPSLLAQMPVSNSPQEEIPTENEEDTLTDEQFEALEKEYLNLDSDSESAELPGAPSGQNDTSDDPKPENQSSDPPVQDNASDPRQSLPTSTNGSRRSGDNYVSEADRYQHN